MVKFAWKLLELKTIVEAPVVSLCLQHWVLTSDGVESQEAPSDCHSPCQPRATRGFQEPVLTSENLTSVRGWVCLSVCPSCACLMRVTEITVPQPSCACLAERPLAQTRPGAEALGRVFLALSALWCRVTGTTVSARLWLLSVGGGAAVAGRTFSLSVTFFPYTSRR